MISRRNAWADGRYIAKKTQQLNQNNEHLVWTSREIMPDCVLTLVRNLFPNPSGRLYMGHKWA